MSCILTIPPYARYIEEAMACPVVSGLRLNTVLPVKDPLENIVAGLNQRCGGKQLWIDLKSRQLRVNKAAYVPYAHLEISHAIEVKLPCTVLLNGGSLQATCRDIDGNKLILEDLPPVPLGAGMSLNIKDPSLKVLGFLTDRDRAYVRASRDSENHNYMLSYVESTKDIEALQAMDPKAQILAKIESAKGLQWVQEEYVQKASLWKERVHLVAARGDLYLELENVTDLPKVLKEILRADKESVAASRLFESFCQEKTERPTCAEVMDFDYLKQMGFERFLLGDELGFRQKSLFKALTTIEKTSANG